MTAPTHAQPPTTVAPAEPPRRSMGTWRGLLLSLGVVAAAVAAWLGMGPRHGPVERPAVDVAAKAAQVSGLAGWAVLAPEASPEWKPTSVSYGSSEGLPTWHAGYHREPDQREYVTVRQAAYGADAAVNARWVAGQTGFGALLGPEVIDGVAWERHEASTNPVKRSLVRRASGAGQVATVVAGNSSFGDLAAFVRRLRPSAG